jgi:hypothetical protein
MWDYSTPAADDNPDCLKFYPDAEWDRNTGYTIIREVFEKAEKHGLKVIPSFVMGSGHASAWHFACLHADPPVPMNVVRTGEVPCKTSARTAYSVPLVSSAGADFEKRFVKRFLDRIHTEFNEAKTRAAAGGKPFYFNRDIDYIMLTYDESYNLDGECGRADRNLDPRISRNAWYTLLAGFGDKRMPSVYTEQREYGCG